MFWKASAEVDGYPKKGSDYNDKNLKIWRKGWHGKGEVEWKSVIKQFSSMKIEELRNGEEDKTNIFLA